MDPAQTNQSSAVGCDQSAEDAKVERLLGEIAELRDRVANLQDRVEQLDQLAHEDSLVKLPNRRSFTRALERLIDRVARYGEQAAILFVDLDGLKSINDNFGHVAGDEALIQVARLLVEGVRKSDLVARVGGDEFAVLLDHADEDRAAETAARLIEGIASCDFIHDGESLPLSVAIGATTIQPNDTTETAMARADHEMYRGKAA